jgi:hypothetical protein
MACSVCDSLQTGEEEGAGKVTRENNSHVAMLPFVFTLSIPNSEPMPQVEITESVSRANNSIHTAASPWLALNAAAKGKWSVQPEASLHSRH